VCFGFKRGTVLAHDVRDVVTWPPGECRTMVQSGSARLLQSLDGAFDLGEHPDRDAGVACRRADAVMTEQDLDHAQIGAGFEKMSREAVPVMPSSA